MGNGRQSRDRQQSQVNGPATSRAEVEESFRVMVKSLRCPHCDLAFTDDALEWGEAWLEGRRDLLRELGSLERDGPYKLKCELCGHRSWLNPFARSVSSAERPDTAPGATTDGKA